MFWDERAEQLQFRVEMTGPAVNDDGLEKAVRRMKGAKAVGKNRAEIELSMDISI